MLHETSGAREFSTIPQLAMRRTRGSRNGCAEPELSRSWCCAWTATLLVLHSTYWDLHQVG